MTYAIATIIYGVSLTEEVSDRIRKWEDGLGADDEELEEGDERYFETNDGPCGFVTQYSGSSNDLVGYCGVKLGEFAECNNVRVKNLRLTPTPEEMGEAEGLVNALHPELRALAGEVGVYFVWSTS